jgi:threonyl-tRNA synthetase
LDLRVEVDGRTESLNKKVRDAQLNQIPLIITIGQKEQESETLSIRTLAGQVTHGISHEQFFNRILEHIRLRKMELDVFKG